MKPGSGLPTGTEPCGDAATGGRGGLRARATTGFEVYVTGRRPKPSCGGGGLNSTERSNELNNQVTHPSASAFPRDPLPRVRRELRMRTVGRGAGPLIGVRMEGGCVLEERSLQTPGLVLGEFVSSSSPKGSAFLLWIL